MSRLASRMHTRTCRVLQSIGAPAVAGAYAFNDPTKPYKLSRGLNRQRMLGGPVNLVQKRRVLMQAGACAQAARQDWSLPQTR